MPENEESHPTTKTLWKRVLELLQNNKFIVALLLIVLLVKGAAALLKDGIYIYEQIREYAQAAQTTETPTDIDESQRRLEKTFDLPPTRKYAGEVPHTIRLESPPGTKILRDSLKYTFDWGDGYGNAWGRWIGETQWSSDDRVAERTYLHGKHDRGRKVTVTGTYAPTTNSK